MSSSYLNSERKNLGTKIAHLQWMKNFLRFNLVSVVSFSTCVAFAGEIIDLSSYRKMGKSEPNSRLVQQPPAPPKAEQTDSHELESVKEGMKLLLEEFNAAVSNLPFCEGLLQGPNSWEVPIDDFYTADRADPRVQQSLKILRSILDGWQIRQLDNLMNLIHLGPRDVTVQIAIKNLNEQLDANQQAILRRLLNSVYRRI